MDSTQRWPVPVYVIETDGERILIDTGLHPDAVTRVEERYGPGGVGRFTLEQEASIAEQVDLATLTRVVLTHLHFDHAGGVDLLPPGVPIVVQRREWDAISDREAVERNHLHPVDYAAIGDRAVLVDGDHDLLGDGSIELLLTPGHTPGHQSVRVGDRLVLGADVTMYASTLDDLRLPMFADDLDAQRASVARLRELRDGGAVIRPGHDPAVLAPGPVEL